MNFQKSSKDIRRLIANFLDDKDIINYYRINKEHYTNICNEEFFSNLLLKRYPSALHSSLKYESEDRFSHRERKFKYQSEDRFSHRERKFKNLYLLVVHYVDLLNNKYKFDYKKYNMGNPKQQYEIFEELYDKKDMNELLI